MIATEVILNEIKKIPESLQGELLDFMRFLEAKALKEKMDITVISESSLGKDWLKPEEDQAWQNL